jgi:hypothetical protein
MPASNTATDLLQLSPPIIQCCILVILISRGLFRKLPAFSAYLILHVIALPVRFLLWHQHGPSWYAAYFVTYWITEGFSAVLTLAIICELYAGFFKRYEELEKLGRRILNSIAAIVIAVASVAAIAAAGTGLDRWVSGMLALRQGVDVSRLGLTAFLLLFAAYFRIRWPAELFGISIGLAFYASCELAGQALRVHFGASAASIYTTLVSSAYAVAVLIWMIYLLKPSRATQQSFELPANDLAVWNDALAGMLNR